MNFKTKLSAGTLLSTLILALILFTSCSILLLGSYYFKYQVIKDIIGEKLDENMKAAITLALNDNQLYKEPYRDSALLFGNPEDLAYYKKTLWGLFPLASIRVISKQREKEKAFLYGASDHHLKNATLYLADHNRPLSLVGNTYIEGTAFLPKSGIRSGFFDQKGFSRKKLIEGIIDSSKTTLPEVNPVFAEQFKIFPKLISDTIQSLPLFEDKINSFLNPSIIYKANAWGVLNNRKLAGNIIVVSDSILEAGPTSKLENIIMVAPYICFKEGFEGCVQAIALDSITIEKKCRLKYPSAIIGIGRDNLTGNTGSTLNICKESIVEGVVMSITGKGKNNIKPVINIKKEGIIKGLVFTTGNTYLSGTVKGAIYTDFFFEQRGPMSMENMLTDATIIKSNWYLWGNYFSLFNDAARQKVIKWLE